MNAIEFTSMLVDISDSMYFYSPSQAQARGARRRLAGRDLASVLYVLLCDRTVFSMLSKTSDLICLSSPPHTSGNLRARADFMRRSAPRLAQQGDEVHTYLASFPVTIHN